jgi:uncharacterized membrane protein YphA (DoxX/SURF4 family)
MLSIFPGLLPFGGFAPLIIRIVIGIILVIFGLQIFSKKRKKVVAKLDENNYPAPKAMIFILGTAKIITGAFMIAGFITQVAAIISAYFFLNMAILESDDDKNKIFDQSMMTYLILIAISLSLLFSGAGFFAIDLPL